MKQKLLSLPGILFLALAVTFASCSKEGPAGATGPAGPAGPQGPAGPAGTNGTNGTQGPAGTVGTANVVYSNWFDVIYDADTLANGDTVGFISEIDVPRLVDSILNKGTVKVYINVSNAPATNPVIMPLPIYDPFILGAIINPVFSNQTITLFSTADVSSFTENNTKYFQYRYVLIPGGTAAGRGSSGNNIDKVDWNDYRQVKAFLGLTN